jgi:hypothetical protein
LALSAATFTVGAPSSGTITGATVGSTITASGLPTGLTIDGVARTWAWDGTGTAGSGSFTLTETLAGYSNSPHANVISYSIVAASSAPVLSNPTNTGQWDTLLPATAFVGDSVHLLIFSDSGLTTQVQHLVKMITPDEMAGGGGASNWSVLATPPPRDATTGVITGLAMGVGPRWWYAYIQRDDGTTSPNSNVINATIIATVGNLPNLQVWLDPSDLTTMFKDTAGTIPVTADGDAVALVLDKSGNGNHFQQATAGLRPLYHTAAGINWLAFDGVDDVLESVTTANMGCATVVIGARIDSTNGPWVGLLGEKSGQASPAVITGFQKESSNSNFTSRTSDAGTLADDTHYWSNKTTQTKNFTLNTIEVHSADGTGRTGAITFGGTIVSLGAVPATGAGNSKINFYGLILAGSTDTQILSTANRNTAEDYIASKSGAY